MCCANTISYASPLHTIEQSLPFKNKNDEFVKDSKSSQYIGEAIIKEEQNWPASMASGTLPIMHIDTEDGVPIVDKVTPIQAGLWIEIPEDCGDKDFALGSHDQPIKLTIRGRGNSTWLADKKPYKLKFESKTELLGMPKHKHFALLAANSVHVLGTELARKAELGWTPHLCPVELVLNGEYLGVYDLIESIKIDKNRLDIFEQEDLTEDPEIIPYGWLVEIDNNDDECQVIIQEPGCTKIRVTYHSPEELSELQEEWLINSFTEINHVINSDSNEEREAWVNYIDAETMAKYFIVREIMQDYDGCCGSMYMYRDNDGDSTRWKMGPIWDTEFSAWSEPTDWTMNILPSWSVWKIIPEIFYTNNFIQSFNDAWNTFYPSKMEDVKKVLLDYALKCADADIADGIRWPEKRPNLAYSYSNYMFVCMEKRAKWIDENKHIVAPGGIESMCNDNADVESVETYTLCGKRVDVLAPGIYVQKATQSNGGVNTKKIIIR